ncbi:MAG TPA: hypothetical protein VLY23_12385 [Candidatus Acidoferrum sp.]|nr:hypothetical protein [Candidatus Acidoferrum sp.]
MTPFDLLFIALFLLAVFILLTAAWFAVRRDFTRARRILFRLLVGAGAYMAVVIVASAVLPRRVITVGEPQCSDDWCVTIAGFKRMPEGGSVKYTVDLQLSSRARRVSQRENNLAVYLTDARGRRYDPAADPSAVPFNVLLAPQESVVATRSFVVPADAAGVGLVITREGGFPIGWLIIGYDTWFRKPPLARLQ